MNTQQTENLDDLFNQINDRLAIIGETLDAYFMVQLIEILKFEIAKNSNPNSIKTMVDRFLGWKLPADFAPDAGITFKKLANADSPAELQYKHEPTGTNLFNDPQAEAMLTHVAKPLIDHITELEAQLVAVQKDAARYQWLRVQNWDSAKLCVVESPKTAVKLGSHCPALHRLDDYIDSAIAGEAT